MHPQNKYNIEKFLKNEQVRAINGSFARNTIDQRRVFLNGFARFLGDTLFQNVRIEDIQNYIFYKTRKEEKKCWHFGTCTIPNFMTNLEIFYAWMMDEGQIEHNPATQTKQYYRDSSLNGRSKPKTPRGRTPLPPEHLFQEIFYSNRLTLLELVVVNLCDQYFRIEELPKIELDDIDFETGMVSLVKEKVKGKEDKFPVLVNKFFDPPDYRLRLIKAYIEQERPINVDSPYLLVANSHTEEYYHSTYKPRRNMYSTSGMQRIFKRAIQKVFPNDERLQKMFTSRVMRHHCVTMFLNGSYGDSSPWKLVPMLGHKDINTISAYTDFRKEDLINACLGEVKKCKSCKQVVEETFTESQPESP